MKYGTYVIAGLGIVLGSVTALAAYPGWHGDHQAYESCKNAVEKQLGSERTVSISGPYWIRTDDNGRQRVLVNADVAGDDTPRRASCEIRNNDRVAAVETHLGRYTSGPASAIATN